jgi:hypothetical protein
MRSSLPALPDKNNDCGGQWKKGSRTVSDASGKKNIEECDIFSSMSKAISQPMQPQFQVIPRLFALLQQQQQQQQQHSLLSQASWGRLEMKPKRDEKQGDT